MTVLQHISRSPICFLVCFVSIVLSVPSTARAQEDPTAGPATDSAPPDTRIPGQTSPHSVNKEQEFAKTGSWRATSEVNKQGESLTTMRLFADQPYVTPAGRQTTPDLVLMCKRNNTILYIDWKSSLGSADDTSIDIMYTLDGGWPQRESWPLSSDKHLLLTDHPIEFIKSLNGKKKLLIKMRPYDLPETTVVFSLDGLDDVLKIIGERCYQ